VAAATFLAAAEITPNIERTEIGGKLTPTRLRGKQQADFVRAGLKSEKATEFAGDLQRLRGGNALTGKLLSGIGKNLAEAPTIAAAGVSTQPANKCRVSPAACGQPGTPPAWPQQWR
jgi:hypothetical protein